MYAIKTERSAPVGQNMDTDDMPGVRLRVLGQAASGWICGMDVFRKAVYHVRTEKSNWRKSRVNRLTQKNKQGEWSLKGVLWEQLNAGEKITRDTRMLLYGALYKLMKYEDTGLTPEQIRKMDELYHEKCREVAELQKKQQWIPVKEQLPDHDCDVLMSFGNFYIPLIGRYETYENGGSFYVGDDEESCSSQRLFVNAWMPLPEPYRQQSVNTAPEPPVQAERKLEDNEH